LKFAHNKMLGYCHSFKRVRTGEERRAHELQCMLGRIIFFRKMQ